MIIRFRGNDYPVEILGIEIAQGMELVVRRTDNGKVYRLPFGGAPAELGTPPEPAQ